MKTILVDRGYYDKLIRIVVPTTNKERMYRNVSWCYSK